MFAMLTLVLLIAVLVVFAAQLLRRGGPRGATEEGTVLITGVSPPPQAGEVRGPQYVTVSGVLHGPTVTEYDVYQRIAVDVEHWPTVGQLLDVVYARNNPDNWSVRAPAQ